MCDRRDKVDAHHLNPSYTSSDDETKNDDENTYVNDDMSKSMASSDADDDNFAIAFAPPANVPKN